MLDLDFAREVARQVVRFSAPKPFLSLLNQAFSDSSGSTDFLSSFWQHPSSRLLMLVAIGIDPTSSAGVWRSDGPNITGALDGLPFAAGGGYIYLYSAEEVKFFRIRTAAAGAGAFSAVAYRMAGEDR